VAHERIEAAGLNLEERVIDIWRCATVVKGGKRFSFAVMSVVGNGAGIMGVGYGKAREVPNAIEKATKDAKKNLFRVSTFGTTIPHEVRGVYGASTVVMLPALPGTGVIAGSAVRAVLECIGVHDVLSKSVGGSNNKKNLVKAAVQGLEQLRTRESVAALRGIEIPPDAALAASLHQAPKKPKFQREERSRGPGRGGPGRGGQGGGRGRGGPGGGGGGGGGRDSGGGAPASAPAAAAPAAAAPAEAPKA
jgi:small subunit ribosomal protein S5